MYSPLGREVERRPYALIRLSIFHPSSLHLSIYRRFASQAGTSAARASSRSRWKLA